MVPVVPTITALALALFAVYARLLAQPLGLGRAMGTSLALVTCVLSVSGIVLLDLRMLGAQAVAVALLASGLTVAGALWRARRRWLVDAAVASRVAAETGSARERRPPDRRPWLAFAVVVAVALGLRLSPSPYLHGGQDQGIYVAVGHLIARTGQHRAIDRVMAGQIRGIQAQWIFDAHRIEPVEESSALTGVREGRWLAGVHVEDASEGRVVPAFFHLLPVWFAMSELDWGFARSTWPLVWFAACSQLAVFGMASILVRPIVREVGERGEAHALWFGVLAAAGMALHPLDLWISTFTVTENVARAALLGSAAFALLAGDAERDAAPGAALFGVLAGLLFTLGAFARGSMIALGVIAVGALILSPSRTPRTRRTLVIVMTIGIGMAITQGIWHSWPYFFSAASNHFLVPRIQPYQGQATAWTMFGVAAVIGFDWLAQRVRPWALNDEVLNRVVRVGAAIGLFTSLALIVSRFALASGEIGPVGTYARSQQVMTVLVRHGGVVGVGLGLVGLAVGVWRATVRELPWVTLAVAILLVTVLKPGIRYEFYYARYLVGDAIPALLVSATALVAGGWARWRAHPRSTPLVVVALAAWLVPPLLALRHPVYWHRDLAHAPAEQAEILEAIPEDAVIVFDDREPGRWRGILATPFFLAYGRNVLVYPHPRMIEGAISSGTPVFLVSGGWEAVDHQAWSRWHTIVVARGVYDARRAEIVEGGAPMVLAEWGGPWEVQRIDPSIFRDSGAFSLHRGSRFVARDEPGRITSAPLALRWPPGAFVELRANERALSGCELGARLVAAEVSLSPPSSPKPNTWRFALPEARASPLTDRIEVTWRCAGEGAPRSIAWHRVSLRWESPAQLTQIR
jgi:hypothetical protein